MSEFNIVSFCYFISDFCLFISPVLSLYVIFLFQDSSLSYQEHKSDIYFLKLGLFLQQLSKIGFSSESSTTIIPQMFFIGHNIICSKIVKYLAEKSNPWLFVCSVLLLKVPREIVQGSTL